MSYSAFQMGKVQRIAKLKSSCGSLSGYHPAKSKWSWTSELL